MSDKEKARRRAERQGFLTPAELAQQRANSEKQQAFFERMSSPKTLRSMTERRAGATDIARSLRSSPERSPTSPKSVGHSQSFRSPESPQRGKYLGGGRSFKSAFASVPSRFASASSSRLSSSYSVLTEDDESLPPSAQPSNEGGVVMSPPARLPSRLVHSQSDVVASMPTRAASHGVQSTNDLKSPSHSVVAQGNW